MLLGDINRKGYERYERGVEFFRRHPLGYKCKLGFLLLQSLVMMLLLGGVIGTMVFYVLENPIRYSRTTTFLAISALYSIVFYWYAIRNRPWRNMLYLEPGKYPGLYRKINRIAMIMGAPAIHRIYLSLEFNAAVASEWIFIPGLRRNILMLGHPLLCALSSKALISVLAHEFGHLAGKHLQTTIFFSHLKVFWGTLHLGIFSLLIMPWRDYFLQTLDRTLHPLYREHEKEADRYIERHFGREYLAEGLIHSTLRSSIIESRQFRCKLANSSPDGDLAEIIRTAVVAMSPEARQLRQALETMPPVNDEHPPLRERLAGMSDSELLAAVAAPPDALDKLLRPGEDFRIDFNTFFHRSLGRAITRMQQEHCSAEALLAAPPPNDAEETLLERIEALELLCRDAESDALLEAALLRHPGSAVFQAIRLVRQLERTGDDADRDWLIREMEILLDRTPILIYRFNDPLVTYCLRHSLVGKLKALFDLRDRNLAKSRAKLNQKLKITDALHALKLTEFEREELAAFFAGNHRYIESVYPIERRYDGQLVSERFLVIRERKISFTNFSKGGDEILKEYCSKSYKFAIGDLKLIRRLDELGIKPIKIEKSKKA